MSTMAASGTGEAVGPAIHSAHWPPSASGRSRTGARSTLRWPPVAPELRPMTTSESWGRWPKVCWTSARASPGRSTLRGRAPDFACLSRPAGSEFPGLEASFMSPDCRRWHTLHGGLAIPVHSPACLRPHHRLCGQSTLASAPSRPRHCLRDPAGCLPRPSPGSHHRADCAETPPLLLPAPRRPEQRRPA